MVDWQIDFWWKVAEPKTKLFFTFHQSRHSHKHTLLSLCLSCIPAHTRPFTLLHLDHHTHYAHVISYPPFYPHSQHPSARTRTHTHSQHPPACTCTHTLTLSHSLLHPSFNSHLATEHAITLIFPNFSVSVFFSSSLDFLFSSLSHFLMKILTRVARLLSAAVSHCWHTVIRPYLRNRLVPQRRCIRASGSSCE